jgi:hypothetical protein
MAIRHSVRGLMSYDYNYGYVNPCTYLICICNIGLRIAEGILLEKNQTTRAGGVQLRFAENSGWTSLGLSFS